MKVQTYPANLTIETHERWMLWRRWLVANLIGEFLGLGIAGALGALITVSLGDTIQTSTWLILGLTLIVAAAIEGSIVGLAQWWVLHRYLSALTRRTWLWATILGGEIAWMVGMSIGSLGGDLFAGQTTLDPNLIGLIFGTLLGPIVGAMLGVVQWFVLRQYVAAAGWWVLANALAWTAGMFVIFAAMIFVDETTPVLWVVVTWAVSGILAGATVAAIHGTFLVWLLRHHFQNAHSPLSLHSLPL